MTGLAVADLALSGLRVLDFSQGIAGPYCAAILRQQGAEVVKVEPRDGDWARHTSLKRGEFTAVLMAYNAGKPSLAIDAATAAGRAALHRMADGADIVVQNFRPGVMDRLGLGYEALSKSNPKLVYVSISGFGASGPLAALPATDNVAQAMSGMMHANCDAEGQPRKIGLYVADIAVAMYAAQLACSALYRRATTGRGQHVQLNMLESCAAFQASAIVESQLACGMDIPRTATAPSGIFATADGRLTLATLDNAMFERLCQVIGRPQWPRDPRLATNALRLRQSDWLHREVAECLALKSSAHWIEQFSSRKILHAPVFDYAAMLADASLQSVLGFDEVHADGVGSLRLPRHPSMSGSGENLRAPAIGEDSRVVLARHGFTDEEIQDLIDAGVVHQAA